MEITADIGAVFYRSVDRGECACEEFFSERIASVCKAIFGYVYWLAIWFQFDKSLVNRLGVEFPTDIGAALVWVFVEPVIDHIAAVVVESDEVLCIVDAIEKPVIPEIVRDLSKGAVDKSISLEFKGDLMLGDADLCVWIVLFDCGECFSVRFNQCQVGSDIFQKSSFLWWPLSFNIGVSGYNVGFIEGDPKCHIASECARDPFGVAGEVFREFWSEHASTLCEPRGECPVPEGDEWLDISRSERSNDSKVVFEFVFVENAFFRLDARPLDGKSIGGVTELLGGIKVFFVAVIVIARNAGNIVLGTRGFHAKLLRPAGEVSKFGGGLCGEALGIFFLPL